MSFNEIIDTLNRQGNKFSFKQVSKEVFATLFPGASKMAETFRYFQAHTYLGSDSYDRIALANKIAGGQPTKFSTWAMSRQGVKGLHEHQPDMDPRRVLHFSASPPHLNAS